MNKELQKYLVGMAVILLVVLWVSSIIFAVKSFVFGNYTMGIILSIIVASPIGYGIGADILDDADRGNTGDDDDE